jgi:porphobilinogen synthase
MSFPIQRPRRLRRTSLLRQMVRETRLDRSDLIYPLFVCEGTGIRREISSMPGNYNLSIDKLLEEVQAARDDGVTAVILFGLPAGKDGRATGAWAKDGITQRALSALKEKVEGVTLIADVCLCEYTDHGHCGVIENNEVANDPTLDLLSKTAVSLAKAGADIIAPSDMMDGRVSAIREGLDRAGLDQTVIMSYAAKYSSAFYGPFRGALDSSPKSGDKKTYQMDAANSREACREAMLDLDEGADILMVKPAGPYLDIIQQLRDRVDLPLAAYQVSGEYLMIKSAAAAGWLDEESIVLETLLGIRRAGADMILTYFAKDAARLLG